MAEDACAIGGAERTNRNAPLRWLARQTAAMAGKFGI